jgi:two-component system, NtrC family, nitrogen regulation sensor histidine kinase NtrY
VSTSPSHPASAPRRRRIGLQLKLVAVLLAIAMVPLIVAAVLIEQTGQIAHNFASNETAFLRPHLERASRVYRDLIATKRDLYYRQVALRAASLPAITALVPPATPLLPPAPAAGDGAAARIDALDALLQATPELHAIAVQAADGTTLVQRSRAAEPAAGARPLDVEEPVAGTGARVVLTFAASATLQEDYVALHQALQRAARIDEVRTALPGSYRAAFWLLVGAVIAMVSVTGILLARRFTARIEALVQGTRRVGAGDLTSRVELPGRDELAELALAFDRMVGELANDREQIAYLQRMGAWQDVARKLAHEIKNPLTPIQLAVQQAVSSYRGDDERYRKLLRDTEEIVTEEIDGLRRLVDAFRTLGQLPRVDPKPLDLGEVAADLFKDPNLRGQLDAHAPEAAVMVRGDRLLLKRVLANLVENGVHAGVEAGKAGRVSIRWRAEPGERRAVLEVDDEGAGVAGHLRERIFEPYVTFKAQGTGLGLAICKKIALEHRGTLTLGDTPAPAGGARFVLSLPLADGEGEAARVEDE